DYILPESSGHIVLAMDEVDRLLGTDFQTDFFSLMRAWHNNAAYDQIWEKISIVMVISTEPYLLIPDAHQSPFNVGLRLYLKDFKREQVIDLNQRHQEPVQPDQIDDFMTLLGGQPYLTRVGLYTLVTRQLSWAGFLRQAPTDDGPFSDHLRRQLWLLRDKLELRQALKQVINHERCDDETSRFRLLRAGLIKGSGDFFTCRCNLYQQYFAEKL
ncbi:MAG: AAA-like domain-containing protein, partial [Anaerolineales bacterium]|nr:AAA-like domain-containing protein [Anaerolineales bacterium]